jgi:hypothetical protein
MAVSRKAVIGQDVAKANGNGPKATGHTPSPGRAPSSRRNGGTGQVPNRRLHIRDR